MPLLPRGGLCGGLSSRSEQSRQLRWRRAGLYPGDRGCLQRPSFIDVQLSRSVTLLAVQLLHRACHSATLDSVNVESFRERAGGDSDLADPHASASPDQRFLSDCAPSELTATLRLESNPLAHRLGALESVGPIERVASQGDWPPAARCLTGPPWRQAAPSSGGTRARR